MPHKDPTRRKAYLREYGERNRERLREYHRQRYAKSKQRWRDYLEKHRDRINAQRRKAWRKYGRRELERARRYGLTVEQLRAVLAPGKCAICGRTDTLHVDHCHATGRVRGVLCGSCNSGLGRFRDNDKLLLAAAAYITEYRVLERLLA